MKSTILYVCESRSKIIRLAKYSVENETVSNAFWETPWKHMMLVQGPGAAYKPSVLSRHSPDHIGCLPAQRRTQPAGRQGSPDAMLRKPPRRDIQNHGRALS